MKPNQSCGACKHFYENPKNPQEGQCRRYPPQLVLARETQVSSPVMVGGKLQNQPATSKHYQPLYPALVVNDPGCGEHQDVD